MDTVASDLRGLSYVDELIKHAREAGYIYLSLRTRKLVAYPSQRIPGRLSHRLHELLCRKPFELRYNSWWSDSGVDFVLLDETTDVTFPNCTFDL